MNIIYHNNELKKYYFMKIILYLVYFQRFGLRVDAGVIDGDS